MDYEGYKVPSLTKQVSNIQLHRGNDREVPPNDYYEYLGNVLSKKDIYNIVQYIKRKLNANGQ